MNKLTVHIKIYPFADCGRNSIFRNTHVGAHVQPGDLVQVQDGTLHVGYYNKERRSRLAIDAMLSQRVQKVPPQRRQRKLEKKILSSPCYTVRSECLMEQWK